MKLLKNPLLLIGWRLPIIFYLWKTSVGARPTLQCMFPTAIHQMFNRVKVFDTARIKHPGVFYLIVIKVYKRLYCYIFDILSMHTNISIYANTVLVIFILFEYIYSRLKYHRPWFRQLFCCPSKWNTSKEKKRKSVKLMEICLLLSHLQQRMILL